MELLTDKRVLITGGGSGIGRDIALQMSALGPDIVLVGRNTDALEETCKACLDAGARIVEYRRVDLIDPTAVNSFIREMIATGGIDVLVNNAGSFVTGNALEGDMEEWDWLTQLNLLTPMRLTRAFAPAMKSNGWGVIINIGSVAAVEGMKTAGAYAASKHGLRGWSLSCYQQLREYGVKVVLINPAYVDTNMTADADVNHRDHMLQTSDIAQAAMLAINTSPACCPEEITLRLTRKP